MSFLFSVLHVQYLTQKEVSTQVCCETIHYQLSLQLNESLLWAFGDIPHAIHSQTIALSG